MEQEAKQTKGKTQWHLMPLKMLEGIINVREFGTTKYKDPNNWKEVDPYYYIDAIIRHANSLQQGEIIDKESGLHHGHHIACGALFLTELMKEAKK